MTDVEINKAIAKACGWQLMRADDGEYTLYDAMHNRVGSDFQQECFNHLWPNYCNDLNLMHHAERQLSPKQQDKLAEALVQIIFDGECSVPCFGQNWYMLFLCCNATAKQHALAYLKAILPASPTA